jgi:uncharacterized membrane protein YfcA
VLGSAPGGASDGIDKLGCTITATIIAQALAVFVGAGVQRVSGIGFALIASPLLVLLMGPYQGVDLANLLALIVATATLATTWRNVDRRRVWTLVPAGLLGVIPGVLVARAMPTDLLQVLVGSLILLGMGLVMFTSRVRFGAVPGTNLATGLASGFMTATAGVGGPALTVYAVATDWEQSAFAATAQVSFVFQSTLSIALKGLPELSFDKTALFVLIVAAGLGGGHLLAGRVGDAVVRRLVTWLALLGAAGAVVKGILGLLST